MAMGDGEVILFPKARDDAVTPDATVKPKRTIGGCEHRVQLVLDQAAHQLRCPACDQVLDPYDWIENHIRNWEHANTRYRQARQQAAQAEERVEKLKRVEANTKARIRRRGLVVSSRTVTAAVENLAALSYAIRQRPLEGDQERVERHLRLMGYKSDTLDGALRELRALKGLHDPPEG